MKILLVETENRKSPGNVLIVAKRYAGQTRFARTDDIPPGCDQVDHIAK